MVTQTITREDTQRQQTLGRLLQAVGCHHIGHDSDAQALFFERPQADVGEVGLVVLATGALHRFVILLDAGPNGIAFGSATSAERCGQAATRLWSRAQPGMTLHLFDLDAAAAASRRC